MTVAPYEVAPPSPDGGTAKRGAPSRRMRIAFLTSLAPEYGWGGSEELWAQCAERFLRDGAAVTVGLPRRQKLPEKIETLQERGGEARYFGGLAIKLARRLFGMTGAATSLPDIDFGWLSRFRPDLVVVSLGGLLIDLRPAQTCRRLGLPYVVIVQAGGDQLWPSERHTTELRECLEAAAAVYFVAEGNRRLAERWTGLSLPDARVVRNPFAVPYDTSIPWPSEDGLRLACVARLEPWHKGQDLLLEVLAKREWRERPVTLSLYGTGKGDETLRGIAARNVLKNVRFAGHTSDVVSIWRSHHALVLPSRLEGLPLALVEAMLCSRPAVVTDVDGNAELIEDGRSGFVAAGPTERALAAAMERAWDARSDLESMGRAAATAVRKQVGPDPAGDLYRLLRERVTALQ